MTTDELKLLLTLNGNKRLEHMESEIFACDNLTWYYINELMHSNQCVDKLNLTYHQFASPVINKADISKAIVYYTTHVLESTDDSIAIEWPHYMLYLGRQPHDNQCSKSKQHRWCHYILDQFKRLSYAIK